MPPRTTAAAATRQTSARSSGCVAIVAVGVGPGRLSAGDHGLDQRLPLRQRVEQVDRDVQHDERQQHEVEDLVVQARGAHVLLLAHQPVERSADEIVVVGGEKAEAGDGGQRGQQRQHHERAERVVAEVAHAASGKQAADIGEHGGRAAHEAGEARRG